MSVQNCQKICYCFDGISKELFALELEEIILKIFLFLDPISLKNSKRTCTTWQEFIDRRIWKSKTGKLEMKNKLISQWKNETPENFKSVRLPDPIYFLVCDQQVIVCAQAYGAVAAFHADTLDVIYTCDEEDDANGVDVQLDVCGNHLLKLLDTKILVIYDKMTGTKQYQTELLDNANGIKMLNNIAVAGDCKGNLYFIENFENDWFLSKHSNENLRGVTHIDGDDKFLAIGTKFSILLWDIKEMQLVEESSNNDIKVKVSMLAMSYPFVFVVGGYYWTGMKVYDINSGLLVRDYQYNGLSFHNIHSNGIFLIISESYRGTFLTLDIQELSNEKLQNKDLWMFQVRRRYCQLGGR